MIAMAAGRSPSGVENAYAAAVASKNNLTGNINQSCNSKAEVKKLTVRGRQRLLSRHQGGLSRHWCRKPRMQ